MEKGSGTAGYYARASRRHPAAWLLPLAAALIAAGYYLSDVLNPFLIALLIAYVLNPLVEALERRRVGRRFAVTVLFGAVFVGVTSSLGFGAFSAAEHIDQIRLELAGERILDPRDAHDRTTIDALEKGTIPAQGLRKLPDGSGWFRDENCDGVRKVGLIERVGRSLGPQVQRFSQEQLDALARALETQAGEALRFGAEASRGLKDFLGSLWNLVGYALLVPVYTFFLLLSLSEIRDRLRDLLPGRYRPTILGIASKIDASVAAFFRGRLLIALAKGLVIWLGLWLVGVRFSFFLGFAAGALSMLPFVGPLVCAPVALLFVYEGGSFAARAVGVVLTFSAAETLETVAYPVVIGRETGLHPLALILALFAFGKLFGLFGLLLAVPLACVLKILFVELVLPELRLLAAEPPPPSNA